MSEEDRVLHLTLQRVWFDKIKAGRKTEEYREKKPYWQTRLFRKNGGPKQFSFIEFRNGYRSNAERMRFRFDGISETEEQFVIKIGERVKVKA
jgi:hypothetical protein